MDVIFPVLENKNVENQIFQEAATEILYSLLETAKNILIKDLKKPILDIFTHNVKGLKKKRIYYIKVD